MNRKRVFSAVGFGALTVALAGLPGASARKVEASAATRQDCCEAQAQEMAKKMSHLQDALENVQLTQSIVTDGDDNMEVFVTSDGGWLGARVKEVTSDEVKELKLPAERGVVLGKIVPDSPAAKAGLKENDVVTEINGQRVEGTEQFRRMIREIPAGRTAQFTVWREGRAQTVTVTLGTSEMHRTNTFVAPAEPGTFSFQMPDIGNIFENGPWSMSSGTRLGIDAENLDGEFGNYFGAPDGEGILVRGVFPDTPAAKAGLKVGDVITSVNGERIRSIGELRAKMADGAQEKTLKLGLIRNKAALSVTVELPAPAQKRDYRSGVRTSI
ncbi:MAG TPA: PDZ domain-containing protein [Candidatus Eremiobacteraceae bacterium]|nr:PDZ domain-containing protein [Candidatus Eremiobacteraceae bacterium]